MGVISTLLGRRTRAITALSLVGAVPDFYLSRQQALEEGDSTGMANFKGALNAAGWLVAEPLMWGITAAGALKGVAEIALETSRDIGHDYRNMKMQHQIDVDANGRARGFYSGERTAVLGGTFVDNEQAATLRQRQMQLLRQHRMATETILGSEARQLHR